MSATGRLTVLAFVAALAGGGCADFLGSKCESAECTDDARISAEVGKQIDAHSSLRFFGIRVWTVNRAVYLDGMVDTEVDRGLAEDVARSVPGVKAVYDWTYLSGNGNGS
jgi:osmotically-inducible protein OsmY